MKVNRGGIQKRGATPLKVDKDGDLDMSGTESKNNKIQRSVRSGRGTAVRGSVQAPRNLQNGKPNFPSKTRPTKAGVATAVVQKAVLKEMGVKDPAQGIRSLRSRTNAHNIDSLEKVRVTGLKQSKAASNQDGGVSDLIAFLERKATRGEEEPLKIKKVCLTLNIAGRHRLSPYGPISGLLSSQDIFIERRPRYSPIAFG